MEEVFCNFVEINAPYSKRNTYEDLLRTNVKSVLHVVLTIKTILACSLEFSTS
jgi:hypothetical protein